MENYVVIGFVSAVHGSFEFPELEKRWSVVASSPIEAMQVAVPKYAEHIASNSHTFSEKWQFTNCKLAGRKIHVRGRLQWVTYWLACYTLGEFTKREEILRRRKEVADYCATNRIRKLEDWFRSDCE